MLLRAEPIGHPPSRRWVIQNIKTNTVWDGEKFVDDWAKGRKYAHPSDACEDMAEVLKGFYGKLEKRTFVVPIEVEVYGPASRSKIARYLYDASILNVQTHEHGNGPGISLVLPTIHWGRIREVKESSLKSDAEAPAVEWGLEDGDEIE
jgi:hypothetical protein